MHRVIGREDRAVIVFFLKTVEGRDVRIILSGESGEEPALPILLYCGSLGFFLKELNGFGFFFV